MCLLRYPEKQKNGTLSQGPVFFFHLEILFFLFWLIAFDQVIEIVEAVELLFIA